MGAVPLIRAQTGRGLHLLPGLTAGQAAGLAATGLACAALWRAGGALPARLAGTGGVAALGLAYVLGRWPARSDGERLAAWLPRILRAAARGGLRAGARVPGWDGLQDVCGDVVRHGGGWSAVLDVGGGDFLLRGPAATGAAQAALRELLHALGGPAQFVVWTRAVRPEERPAAWDPGRAPEGLRAIAAAYAAFWADGPGRRAVVRRTLLVLTVGARGPAEAAGNLAASAAAAAACLQRAGLQARRLGGVELAVLLREAGGAADLRAGEPGPGAWRVEGPHA